MLEARAGEDARDEDGHGAQIALKHADIEFPVAARDGIS
jgi:hypothetical protein